MAALTSLSQAPPVLEFYDDLHGAGGMFIPADWAILVGVADMRRIAADVVRVSGHRVAEIMAGSTGRRPTAQEVLGFTAEAATRRCMAHELGHALLSRGANNPYAPDDEAGADYYAGRLDAARDKNLEFGEMFFHAIGCVGPTCDHPPPDMRAAAYRAGYLDQKRGR
jgi:hypothetical protein